MKKIKNNRGASGLWDLSFHGVPDSSFRHRRNRCFAATSGITTNSISGWPQGPEITSASAVVMEDSSDTILYAKDMDTALSLPAQLRS